MRGSRRHRHVVACKIEPRPVIPLLNHGQKPNHGGGPSVVIGLDDNMALMIPTIGCG